MKEFIVVAVNLKKVYEAEPARACFKIMDEAEKRTCNYFKAWMQIVVTQVDTSIMAAVDASKDAAIDAAMKAVHDKSSAKAAVLTLLDAEPVMALHEVDMRHKCSSLVDLSLFVCFFLNFYVCAAVKELRAVDKRTWLDRWQACVDTKLSQVNIAALEAAQFVEKIEAKLSPSDALLKTTGKTLADLTIAQARCKWRECQRQERERERERESRRERKR